MCAKNIFTKREGGKINIIQHLIYKTTPLYLYIGESSDPWKRLISEGNAT